MGSLVGPVADNIKDLSFLEPDQAARDTVVGLVGADFHFLGDVIAGAFLGVSTGWLTVVLWERGQHHLRTAMTPDFPGKSDRDLAPDFHYLVPRKAKEVGPVN